MLAAQDIDRIEDLAEDTLRQVFGDLKLVKLPININEIVNFNNLVIEKVHFRDPDVSGSFDRGKSRIRINDSDNTWRQAFTPPLTS